MRPYLITTGLLFTLLAAAHILRTIAEWSRLATDPGFILEGPGIGLFAAALGPCDVIGNIHVTSTNENSGPQGPPFSFKMLMSSVRWRERADVFRLPAVAIK